MSDNRSAKNSTDDCLAGQSTPSLSMNENDPLLEPEAGHDIKSKKGASPWHVLISLFFITFGLSALAAPLVQFYTDIICESYYQTSNNAKASLLTWMMGDLDKIAASALGTHDCSIPEVQSIVSRVQTIITFLDSASTLVMAGFYGTLSDRLGRRLVFRIFFIGGVLVMLCYIAVAKFQDKVGVTLLVVAPLVRGLFAGDVIVSAVIVSYISDCTAIETRTLFMSRMVGIILASAVCGPMVASMIILKTGSVVPVFYLLLVIYIGFYLYATYYMPESLSQQAMETAQQKATQQRNQSFWQKINLFSSLSILVKTSSANVSRYAIPILAAIQFLLATIGQPPILLYAMLQFKWTAYEGGFLASSMALTRLLITIWILPYLFRMMKSRWQQDKVDLDDGSAAKEGANDYRRVLFELKLIRSGLGMEMICIIFAALATSGSGYAFFLVCQSVTVIAQPPLLSLYTTLVDPSEIGALCGAQAVLNSIAALTTVTGINFIYSVTLKTMPSLFLYVCAGACGLGCLLAFLVHPVKPQNEHSIP